MTLSMRRVLSAKVLPHVGALLASLLLALLVVGPAAALGPDAFLGRADSDLPAHLWSLWWASSSPDLANFPAGGARLYILEPLNLIIQRLIAPSLGLAAAHHAAAGLAVASAAMGGWVLGRTVHDGRHPARSGVLGLLLVGLCQPLLEALSDGVGEFTWVGLLAGGLAACLHLARHPGARSWLLCIAASALTAWSCWYHGLMLGLCALVLGAAHGRRALLWIMAAQAGAVVVLFPAIHGFAGSDLEPLRTGIIDAAATRFPLRELLPLAGRHLPARDGWKLAIWALMAITLVRRGLDRSAAAWLAIALLGFTLSLGSVLGGLPLPFWGLNLVLDLVGRPLHVPARFMVMGWLGLVALACSAPPRLSLVLVTGLLLGEQLSPRAAGLPLPVAELSAPAPLRALAGRPVAAVLSLPSVLSDDQSALDLEALQQLAHHQPIPRFPIFPTNEVATQGLQLARATALVTAIQSIEDGQPPATLPPSTADLRQLGYGWVVVDQAWSGHSLVDNWLGSPILQDPDLWVYAL